MAGMLRILPREPGLTRLQRGDRRLTGTHRRHTGRHRRLFPAGTAGLPARAASPRDEELTKSGRPSPWRQRGVPTLATEIERAGTLETIGDVKPLLRRAGGSPRGHPCSACAPSRAQVALPQGAPPPRRRPPRWLPAGSRRATPRPTARRGARISSAREEVVGGGRTGRGRGARVYSRVGADYLLTNVTRG